MSITTNSGISVKSIWSKAGFATCVHVTFEGISDSVLFDCGVCESSAVSARHIFVSHGHVDHIGALVNHARARALSYPPAFYYVPENCIQPILDIKRSFEVLDEREIPMEIKSFAVGDNLAINNVFKVFSFPTRHRVRSQGYGIICTHKALKSEFRHLTSKEIATLKKQGVEINTITEKVEFVYTGDTKMEGLLEPGLEFIFTSEILVIELTYLDGIISKAHKWGHIHLDEIIENSEKFHNQQIIFMHLSSKYSPYKALSILESRLPDDIRDRCAVALISLGGTEHVTTIAGPWRHQLNTVAGWGWATRRSTASARPGSTPAFRERRRRRLSSGDSRPSEI